MIGVPTDHSIDRLHDRMKIPKKSSDRVVQNALDRGHRRTDYTGSIRRYLDKLYLSHNKDADNIIVYSNMVFLFDENVLITVVNLPSKHLKDS